MIPKKAQILVAALILSTALLSAAPPQALQEKSAPPTGNRYLLIVENSATMEKRDDGLRQTVFDFVNTGFRGRMEAGDTFGVWTFNATVDSRFPMQMWDSRARLDLGTRVNTFLRNQGYLKRAKLNAAMIDVSAVGESVSDLTVVMLTDGNDRMEGTPFDCEINALYRQLNPQMAKQKLPVVTGLTIRAGQYVAYSVVAAGDPLTLPPPPERPRPKWSPGAKTPRSAVASVTNAPTRRVAPIIMTKDGKDPEAVDHDPAPTAPATSPAPTMAPVASTVPTPSQSSTRSTATVSPELSKPIPVTPVVLPKAVIPSASTTVSLIASNASASVPHLPPLPSTPTESVKASEAVKVSTTPILQHPGLAAISGNGFTWDQVTQSLRFSTESASLGQSSSPRATSAQAQVLAQTISRKEPAALVAMNSVLPMGPSRTTVHARSSSPETLGALVASPLSASTHGRSSPLLLGALLMFVGSLLGIWGFWTRANRGSRGSYISRAMPRPGDAGPGRAGRTRP